MTHPCFKACDISFAWDSTAVFLELNLVLKPRTVSCILGKSGCGKTSLFTVLTGLAVPHSGHIYLGQRDITGEPGWVGYMLQKDLLLEHLRIIDNVALPHLAQGLSRKKARAEALELLKTFQLDSYAHHWPRQLSGGMRQRIALLRSFSLQTDYLFLDEPFSALDAFTRSEIHQWFLSTLHESNRGACLITHDVDEALCLADTIYVMRSHPDPSQGARLYKALEVERKGVSAQEFSLTEDYLAYKKQLLSSLED